tara:strand:- start:303 stop:656 length:354 start_codon:yes stop_codon:yes gene_type:complete
MTKFQRSVIGIASSILIITLVLVGITLYHSKKNQDWPPVVSDCPDYWITRDSNDEDGAVCYNANNLGSASCNKKMDFSKQAWQGSTGTCRKSQWAKKCKLTWDGITNNGSVCDTDSN